MGCGDVCPLFPGKKYLDCALEDLAGKCMESHASRNEVERTLNRLKNFRAVATRYDKRAYIFHGTVTVAAIWLWLRP